VTLRTAEIAAVVACAFLAGLALGLNWPLRLTADAHDWQYATEVRP
jgi:hypothetical protein